MPKKNPKPPPALQQPGPGRSTADAAFNEVRKEIAERNERTHQEARKLRISREREQQQRLQGRDY